MRVTFDTNQIDAAARPGTGAPASHLKVNAALRAPTVEGFFSETVMTLEGIMKADRARVMASTAVVPQPERLAVIRSADVPAEVKLLIGDGDIETVHLEVRVEQPARSALPPAFAKRVAAARAAGLRVLKAVPRVGALRITDDTGTIFLSNDDRGQLAKWQEKVFEVSEKIESLGVGFAQVKTLGQRFASSGNLQETWFRALTAAKDIHERNEVTRAFSEWADGDTIAAHVAYEIEVFCTRDKGNSNGAPSILDQNHRQWLTANYGVRFMTIDELANHLA